MKDNDMNMIENTRSINITAYAVLILGCIYILTPLYIILTTASTSYADFVQNGGELQLVLGTHLWQNLYTVSTETLIPRQILNSAILGVLIGGGGILFAILAAYTIVFFGNFIRKLMYGCVIVIILVPGDTLTIVMYQVASNIFLPINTIANLGGLWTFIFGYSLDMRFNILNSYGGMSLPLMIEAGGTLVFVQYFRTIPPSMVKAAQMDGAGPFRFLVDILIPQSKPTILNSVVMR